MKLTALLLLISLPAQASETPLAFSARIQSEELAEEAIDLLHCLAEALEMPWELNEGSKAPYQLKVEEKGGSLSGHFLSPAGETPFQLSRGEANKICEELTPDEEKEAAPSLPRESPAALQKNKTWLWVGATVAVLAGGFLLWKSQPAHRSMRME